MPDPGIAKNRLGTRLHQHCVHADGELHPFICAGGGSNFQVVNLTPDVNPEIIERWIDRGSAVERRNGKKGREARRYMASKSSLLTISGAWLRLS